jgi:hypothetical protein
VTPKASIHGMPSKPEFDLFAGQQPVKPSGVPLEPP